MEKQIQFRYVYQMKGHETMGAADTEFYAQLPHVSTAYVNPRTGRPDTPAPGAEQLIQVIGTTVLTSATVAAIVQAWIANRRRRITIEIDGTEKAITYEGPDPSKDVAAIKDMIDRMAEEKRALLIRAVIAPDA